MTPEQQELIDLIRNEVAELVMSEEEPENDTLLLDRHLERAECIANAAEVMGLEGLSQCCRQIVSNFTCWHDDLDIFQESQRQLLDSWAIHFLGYLQYIHEPEQLESCVDELVIFMSDQDWHTSCLGDSALALRRSLLHVQLDAALPVETDSAEPQEVTEDMVSIALDDDVRPELLEGLLIELPEQCETFTQSLLDYQSRAELSFLLVGQRIAHTIKGAANVVGVKGIANLMHYTEEILQQVEQADCQPDNALLNFLLEVADCLATMTDLLSGVSSGVLDGVGTRHTQEDLYAPEGALSVMKRLLACTKHLGRAGVSTEDSALAQLLHPEGMMSIDHSSVVPPQQIETSVELKTSAELKTPAELKTSETNAGVEDAITQEISSVNTKHQTSASIIDTTKEATKEATDIAGQLQSDVRIGNAQFNELQRFAGENIIAETQLQNRLDQLTEYLQQVLQYQNQLRHMADDLQLLVDVKNVFGRKALKRVGLQGVGVAASHSVGQSQTKSEQLKSESFEVGLDPLELEHYNEMHSFAHQLLELVTDAREQTLQAQEGLLQIRGLGEAQHQRNRDNHELLLRSRMLPFSTLESRLQRCVRQASRQSGKDIHFVIEGAESLVDSIVLQQLADPLMHLLRNSVDHGIESAEKRRAKGKKAQGSICLSVKEAGGSLTIECRDDGGGIDRSAVVQQAIRQGLLADSVDVDSLSDEVIERYILQPGFSTRTQASQLSGRGIGLDAVVSQLQVCRGSLSVVSTTDKGCSFTASLPQRMQSGYGLLASCAGRSLALLNRGVKQIIYLEPADVDQIAFQGGYFDGHQIVAVDTLDTLLAFGQNASSAATVVDDKASRPKVLLLIERVGEAVKGVMVDDVFACRELVIKPLNKYTPQLPGIVGATVLGDGSVAPVIDSAELIGMHQASVTPSSMESGVDTATSEAHTQSATGARPMALVVDDSLSVRRSLSEFVTDLGMDVRTAKDGFEAIHVIEQELPTLMLVDLEMPRMNGLELTAHVRAHQQAKQVPVIMITSRNTEKHRRMASEAGVNQFLPKPYSEDELAHTIQAQMAS